MDGYRELKQGQIVKFKIEEDPKGLQASEVIPVV
jgi:cold shock CspA family protein